MTAEPISAFVGLANFAFLCYLYCCHAPGTTQRQSLTFRQRCSLFPQSIVSASRMASGSIPEAAALRVTNSARTISGSGWSKSLHVVSCVHAETPLVWFFVLLC